MTTPHAPPPLEFRKRESVRDGSARLAKVLAIQGAEWARLPDAELPEAVHGQRLLLKRARALVGLLRPALGASRARNLRSRLRTAARRLSKARDLEVGHTLLEELAAGANADRLDAVRSVLNRYTATIPHRKPAARRTRTELRLAAIALDGFAKNLRDADWNPRGWSVLEDGLHASYRRARRRFKRASTLSKETAFHRWRTAVKALQYHVGLFRPTAPQRLNRLVRDLDRLGTCLGSEHDLAVLDLRLAKQPTKLGGSDTLDPVRKLVANRRQFHRKEALKLGRHLLASRPLEFVDSIHRAWRAWRNR